MKKTMRLVVRGIFCLMGVVVCAAVVTAQAPPSSGQNAGQAPAGPTAPAVTPRLRPAATVPLAQNAVGVDGSEAMFTTMCALLAAGFEADVSAENWSPMRAQLRDRLQHQQGPAVDLLRAYYKQHEL